MMVAVGVVVVVVVALLVVLAVALVVVLAALLMFFVSVAMRRQTGTKEVVGLIKGSASLRCVSNGTSTNSKLPFFCLFSLDRKSQKEKGLCL